jgi:GNAT superfamily N-acetyltransferase
VSLSLRDATPHDHRSWIHLVPFLGNDDPLPTEEQFRAELVEGTLFLEDGGAAIGVVRHEAYGDEGFVRVLVVHPDRRREGHGRALMAAAAARLAAAGCDRWCLNVFAGNGPALALYAALGFARAHAKRTVLVPWSAVERLPGAGLVAGPVDAGDEAALEARFALLPGQVARLRALPGRVLVGVRRDDALALACFDPAFPGAGTFRCSDPSLARPLLAAIRPHARPGEAALRLVVDDDDPLTAALVAAGASVTREYLHLRGPLPPRA